MTNKVTEEEADGVKHHCLNFLDPLASCTVVDFRDRALPIVERLFSEGKLPVVVGGTHYYIESLLWKVLVADGEEVAGAFVKEPLGCVSRVRLLAEELELILESAHHKLGVTEWSALKEFFAVKGDNDVLEAGKEFSLKAQDMPEEEACQVLPGLERTLGAVSDLHPDPGGRANRRLHARLKEVDKERADRLHYNDVRKVLRSLEIFEKNRIKHSDILKEQMAAEGGSELGGPLRYENTAILWITADQEVLDKRLDDRVDDMMSRGLLKEMQDFHKDYNQRRVQEQSPSYTQGIFQSIGLKEFHSYLTLEDKSSPKADSLLQEGLEALKIATRRYARRQIKWIRGRFLRSADRQVPPVYALDATDPSMWDEKVYNPAVSVVKFILGTGPPPEQQPLPKEKVTAVKSLKGERLCRVCMRIFIGDHQWEIHQKSKKHQAMLKKKKKQKDQKIIDDVPNS